MSTADDRQILSYSSPTESLLNIRVQDTERKWIELRPWQADFFYGHWEADFILPTLRI